MSLKTGYYTMNLGIEPDVITFNPLIKGWCKIGKMSVAMHITKVMLKMGMYPSQITYGTLIQGWSTTRHDDGETTRRVHDQSQSDS